MLEQCINESAAKYLQLRLFPRRLFMRALSNFKVTSLWTKIQRGVRQGCVVSPDLFSPKAKADVGKLENMNGMRVGSLNFNNIRYAGDTVLIADTEENTMRLVSSLNEECRRDGLKINIEKAEVM